MNALTQLLNRLRTFWAEQSVSRRVLFGMLVLFVVIASVAGSGLLTKEKYAVLFKELPPDEAANIVSKLKAANIPYELDPTGTEISVAQSTYAQTKITLAGEGIPTQSKGLDIFDNNSIAVPPDVQKINYLRALQGELARSIQTVDAVQTARVHLARPEPSPFVREQKPVTASVVVKLRPGRSLSRQQVAGIVALVSRAIENLKPENVIIVDTTGRQLSDSRTPESEGIPTAQMEYRRDMENYLAAKAESILAAHLGPGRAVVKVSADIDFKRLRERSKSYLQPGVISSERSTEEKSTGGSSARGVPGTGSNARPGGVQQAGGVGGSSNGQTNATDYLVPFTERELEDRMGGLQRLTIAALVDLAPGEGENNRTLISVTDAQDLIKQAIGYKQGRDEIKVTDVRLGIPDNTPEPPPASTLLDRTSAILALVRNGSLALAALVILTMLGMLLLRRPKAPPEEVKPPEPPPPPPPPPKEPAINQDDELDEFMKLVRQDPDFIVELLLSLLDEEETPETTEN